MPARCHSSVCAIGCGVRAWLEVKSNVQLFAEPNTETELATILEACFLKDSSGMPGRCYVGCLLDVKLITEPSSQPHKRVGPCKKQRVMKLVGAWLKARAVNSKGKSIQEGDVAFLLDGGKHGNKSKFMAPFLDFLGSKPSKKK